MPAASFSLAVLAAGHRDVLARSDPAPAGAVPSGLLEALAQVPGPRDPRGARYDFVPVLAVAVCATLAGVPSYAAIAEWAGDADDEQIPLLLAISANGPQLRSHSTREFLAGVAIAQQFGRPHTAQDQAWIETLFGHVKSEWPHLEKIRDPGELDTELDKVRLDCNGVRLHAAIGYVSPDDEHEGTGDAIRQQRRDGLAAARENRIAYRRTTTLEENQ